MTCAACKSLQEHGKDQKQPTPGAKVYAVSTLPSGQELKPWDLAAQ